MHRKTLRSCWGSCAERNQHPMFIPNFKEWIGYITMLSWMPGLATTIALTVTTRPQWRNLGKDILHWMLPKAIPTPLNQISECKDACDTCIHGDQGALARRNCPLDLQTPQLTENPFYEQRLSICKTNGWELDRFEGKICDNLRCNTIHQKKSKSPCRQDLATSQVRASITQRQKKIPLVAGPILATSSCDKG